MAAFIFSDTGIIYSPDSMLLTRKNNFLGWVVNIKMGKILKYPGHCGGEGLAAPIYILWFVFPYSVE
jgi:hypothetical protein